MKRYTVSGLLVLTTALVLLAGFAGCGNTQQKFVLKFNHVLGPTEPYHLGFLKWAEQVSKRTNGNLTIEVSHSAGLGVEEKVIDQIRNGANLGQNTDSARLGQFIPDIAVMNAPYFVDSIDEVQKLKSLPMVKAWLDRISKEFGVKVLSFYWVQGFRHFITNKPIRTPADLSGLKIRTPGAAVWQESIRALGATPVALDFGKILTGIEQKAIDGTELVYANLPAGRFYEALKYVNETKHILLINFEIISQKFFDSLPREYQVILEEECDKAGLETSAQIMGSLADEAKKLVQEKGMVIVGNINLAPFKTAGEKAYEVLKLQEVRDQLYAQLGKK